MSAAIHDIAFFLPERTLTNEMLADAFPDVTADLLFKQSGVRTRHIAEEPINASDLACSAADLLFAREGAITRHAVDAIIYCTEAPDYKAPATACLVHSRLRLKASCLALDIPGGCTGFVNGLLVAKSLIGTNGIRNVLLLTAETPSWVIPQADLQMRQLFGDGACATMVTESSRPKIGDFVFGTDGSGARVLWVERSGTREPADITWLQAQQDNPNGLRYGRMLMDGPELLHFALKRVPPLLAQTLAANGLEDKDIDAYLFHQASWVVLRALRRKCCIADERFLVHLEECGNTVSSSIPITLQHARESGRLRRGARVMLVGFGIGLSWAATIIEVD